MIKIRFIHNDHERLEAINLPFLLIKIFHNFDEFLYWYFYEDGDNWFIDTVLEGKEIITGEIKQKGTNNN